jgi:23S rRNA pseudouridine1911/1915/1917 synthase
MEQEKPVRLDAYIISRYPNFSRGLAQKLIKNGHVKLNGMLVTKTSTKVNGDELLEIDQSSLESGTEKIDLTVLYEDENLVVIDKPVGILVHSKGAYNPETTVADWLKERKGYDFPADNNRGGIVHRLDRATSGVMICAKNKATLGFLQKQFQVRKTKKTYIALASGHLKQEHALIDLPIARNPKKPQTFRVESKGKPSHTEYKVLDTNDKYSLLELKPLTGRTHQLRVHLHYLGNPIVGDVLYDGEKADRMFLHASELEITIPKSDRKVFKSPIPKEFKL